MPTSNWKGFGCPECQNGARQSEPVPPMTEDQGKTVVVTRHCENCRIDYDLFYKLDHAVIYEHGPGRETRTKEVIKLKTA